MKKTLLPLLLCASALTLAGCNLLMPSSGKSSKKKKSSTEPDTSVVSDSDSELSSEVPPSSDEPTDTTTGGGQTTTGGQTNTGTQTTTATTTSGGTVSYTAASAIDAVAELLTAALGQTCTAYHDTDGDYWIGNFGDSTSWDDLKNLCESYLIPTGFSPETTSWGSDTFQDGTPVDYKDYVWNNSIYLEYCVYTVSGQSQTDYNGNYLQIDAGTI